MSSQKKWLIRLFSGKVAWIMGECRIESCIRRFYSRTLAGEHGVRTVKLPWAEPGSRFTALFERLAIDWLLAAIQKAVGERLRLSWDEVHAIQERAVKRGVKLSRLRTWVWTKKHLRAVIAISPS
jgi:hypothetical protein